MNLLSSLLFLTCISFGDANLGGGCDQNLSKMIVLQGPQNRTKVALRSLKYSRRSFFHGFDTRTNLVLLVIQKQLFATFYVCANVRKVFHLR